MEPTPIPTALITAPSRADELIFGRSLLERLIILCTRAGIDHFIVESSPSRREPPLALVRNVEPAARVDVVDSLDSLVVQPCAVSADTPCLRVSGNLVM